jgi:hypothetical protein
MVILPACFQISCVIGRRSFASCFPLETLFSCVCRQDEAVLAPDMLEGEAPATVVKFRYSPIVSGSFRVQERGTVHVSVGLRRGRWLRARGA